jgi:hypothetical protein
MTDGADACPLDATSNEVGLSAPADAELIAQGWARRHFIDPNRVQESIELYESMGFEVHTRKPHASEFGTQCRLCASTSCGSFVLIYTRKKIAADHTTA